MGFFDYVFKYQFQKYLDITKEIDSRVSPKALIKQIQNAKAMQKFIKALNKPTQNHIKIVRRIHVCGLLITHSNEFYDSFMNDVKLPACNDEWLNKQVLKPYLSFLQKCCSSSEEYLACKKVTIKYDPFESLFFSINMLKHVFKSVAKIQLLGKFYNKKHPTVISGLIQGIAVQTKQIYFLFKSTMMTILQQPDKYILTHEHQLILKDILINDLAIINEQMKFLLLNKEFYPYGKSIGIKLFRTDEATVQLERVMNGIVTDHIETNRQMEKQQMQDKLFNSKEGFNIKYFEETLSSAGLGQNSTMFKMGRQQTSKLKQIGGKNQQIVAMDQDDDEEDEEGEEDESPAYKKQVQTNQTNINKVDDNI